MSPALNVSFVLQHLECGNAVKICNGIMFDFYLGRPHVNHNIPHIMGLPDHIPSFWQTLTAVVVVFGSYPLLSSQIKQALEPAVVPV